MEGYSMTIEGYDSVNWADVQLDDFVMMEGKLHEVTVAGGQEPCTGTISIGFYNHISCGLAQYLGLKFYRKVKNVV
jgi:hypothetical protein